MNKNTTDNKPKKKPVSSLKNSVHVEPVWFSLDNLTLCAALTTAQWVIKAIKVNFTCAEAFLLRTGRFFLLFSSDIETSSRQNKKSSHKLEIPFGTKFLRVLIFTIFAIFPAIRKNNFPPKN